MASDPRAKWLFAKVGECLALDAAVVQEHVVRGGRVNLLAEFYRDVGPMRVFFYYQPQQTTNEFGETTSAAEAARVVLTDGADEGLRGRCVYFVKLAPRNVVLARIEDDLVFGEIDVNILDELKSTIRNVIHPALSQQEDQWGELQVEEKTQSDYLDNVDRFAGVLEEAISSLKDDVHLARPERKFVTGTIGAQDVGRSASNPEIVASFEGTLFSWIKQVEHIIAESELIRKENDDVGPSTELEYWKARMAKFNSITDQLKSKDFKCVLAVLKFAKSKLLKKWKDLDVRITDSANEAKDNVKYLYTLEKNCEPLYKADPVSVVEALPSLLTAIKIMHSIARYYNTSDRMTTLFVKITNQMILNCKAYLTRDGSLWEQERPRFLARLRDCVALNQQYQAQYHAIKGDASHGRPFNFSEVTIFGKFDLFCRRLERLMELFETLEEFNAMTRATMEGLEPIVAKFADVVSELRKKPYDLTDYRRHEFEVDYKTFVKGVREVEAMLAAFINAAFGSVESVHRALTLIAQFRSFIHRAALRPLLQEKILQAFLYYGKEVEALTAQYEERKENPLVSRNRPPVSGNIGWSRQLLRKIEVPMQAFQAIPELMDAREAKPVIRAYNRLARILVQFEMVWHQGWCKAVQEARAGLQATLLVRHPSTSKLYVNFDNDIIRLLCETKAIQRLGLDVPASAVAVVLQENKLKMFSDRLKGALQQYESLNARVPDTLRTIVAPALEEILALLEPGLTTYTWTSLNIDSYITSIVDALTRVEDAITKANDILEYRITQNLYAIRHTALLDIPQFGSLMTIEEFLEKQMNFLEAQVPTIELKNRGVETAVHDLVALVTAPYSRKEVDALEQDITVFISSVNKQLFEALLGSVRGSLNILKDRFASYNVGVIHLDTPVFRVDLEIDDGTVILQPSLDQVQKCVNYLATQVLQSTKNVNCWGQRGMSDESEKKNFFHDIASNKEIVKAVLQLTGSFTGLKRSCAQFVATFQEYDYLWKLDRQKEWDKFKAKSPGLEDFEVEIERYEHLLQETEALPGFRVVGSLSLDTTKLREVLKKHASDWKQMFGARLNDSTRSKMEALAEFIEEHHNSLTKGTGELGLEDVNKLMGSLEDLRVMEAEIFMKLAPLEDTYEMLRRFKVQVRPADQELFDGLQKQWLSLKKEATTTMEHLQEVAPRMKTSLERDVVEFRQNVRQFKIEYDNYGPMVKGIEPKVASQRLGKFRDMFKERETRSEILTLGEKLFGLPQTEYPDLVNIGKELKLLERLYALYNDVASTIGGYDEVLWTELDTEKMNQEVTDFQNRQKKMPRVLRDWDAFQELTQVITDFGDTLPLIQLLKEPFVIERHWTRVSEICGVALDWKNPDFRVKNILEAKLSRFKEDVEDVCIAAGKENEIKKKFDKIMEEWNAQNFEFTAFKKRGELLLSAGAMSDLMALLEDSQANLGSLLGNRYNGPFRADLQKWTLILSTIQERIELWLQVQALWIYLEAVFSGGDIAAQLPQEAKRFQNIDKTWDKIMAQARDVKGVVKFCFYEETLKINLPVLQESLEICQKSLAGYLEAKRNIFPRFFFVSDAQLLEILGQGSNPHTIQPHLSSIFDAIDKVEFDKVVRSKILGMYSKQGEYVPLSAPVAAEGNIEDWLNKLLDEQRRTVKDICRAMSGEVVAMLGTAEMTALQEFIDKYPAMVSLLGTQLWWTFDSEDSFNKSKTDKQAIANAKKKFELVLRHMVDITTEDLKPMRRTRIETLITIHIHQVDIHAELMKKRIKSPTEFEWLKQTRFYWRADQDECMVEVTNCEVAFCYEYTGVAERLVITPLTDRIYISCAQAMQMFFGGAPAGPAGTGKTETTKDMGKTCGRYFITINCSDQMDYRAMGKLFSGIAQSGIWCGFDEINRVELAVLSVVAAQIACVFTALKVAKPSFLFTDGNTLRLDRNAGVFITMNPGYAGRTELPENMKALFRTIAVVVPDRQIIMRVRLAASGFQENTALAKKFFVLYRLCEEQLSKQNHYDFGLRNILSVLRTAGATKRANPTQKEVMVLMRVLRDMNLSKLVDEDQPLFLSLVQDLFPGVSVDKEEYPQLQGAIEEVVHDENLVNSEGWNLKVIQFFEQYRVRHGLCIMGPSGAGKSSSISVLARALSKTTEPIKEMRMNPKAITATQMFGRLDVATNDWTDGIFSALWRLGCKTKPGRVTWIELDGPVDTLWIENLNTVLDDTRTLTLANGDRIIMPQNLKLVFEVGNLDNASPATVSRLGIVYVGPNALGWQPILQAWLQRREAAGEADQLKMLFDRHIDPFFAFLRDSCTVMQPNTSANAVGSMLRLLAGLLPTTETPTRPLSGDHLSKMFVFALIWSLGGTLEREDRTRVHQYLERLKLDLPVVPSGSDDSVYEFVVGDNGEWQHWGTRVDKYEYPRTETPPFSSVLVPTVDNVRTEFLIRTVAKQAQPVLLIGESGTAKTVTIQSYVSQLNKDEFRYKLVSFSSATTPDIFQRNVEASVEKRMGTTYGPPAGKRMVLFVDDVNMPEINEWGDQITNEIVRQLIGDGGFYSLESKKPGEFMQIKDLSFLAAMNQPGGGRNDIPMRLKRLFNIFNVTLPSAVSVEKIYAVFAEGHFCAERGFKADVVEVAKKLPALTRRLWDATKRKMLPTPAKFHYIFNLRDLSRIFQTLLVSTSDIITSSIGLLQLWRHECNRVLPDKFTNDDDVEWFNSTAREQLRATLGDDVAEKAMVPKYFVDFMREPEEPDDPDAEVVIPKVYEPIESFGVLRTRVQDLMDQLNEGVRGARMEIVLFDFALGHLMRISRIIRTPRGNALLVGVGGSGKQSLTRLASFVAQYKTFQITITRTYNVGNFLEDLKALYRMAALVSPVTFLFTDNEVKDERFLEYINMILASGEIAGLFPKDELDALLDELRPQAVKAIKGFVDTAENLYNFFIDKVRDNLHVVLCFSPVGEKFRVRARKFPGLVNGCTIDWFPPWPAEALHSVASKFLDGFDVVAEAVHRESLVDHMCHVHKSIGAVTQDYFQRYRKYVYVTPKSYLSFINSFRVIYSKKRGHVAEMAKRVNTGLKKLLDASSDVAKMKVELIQKEKDLAVAQKKCSEMIVEITAQKAQAEIVKESVQKVKDSCQIVASTIEADKVSAERDLLAAKPALERAEQALNLIKPADIATIKKLGKPPPLVKRIMDGVLLLRSLPILPFKVDPEFLPDRQLPVPTWAGAQAAMNDMKFLQYLIDFPKENINDETCELLLPYTEMQEDFNATVAAKACGNVAGLCTWIAAMVEYHYIYINVEPKKARLRVAEGELRVATRKLNAAQMELDDKQRELDIMQEKFDSAMREKQALQEDAELTKNRLEAAEALISGLSGERERWTAQSKEFDDVTRRLIGDVVVAAAFLSYAGPFNQNFRTSLMAEHWSADLLRRKVPLSSGLEIIKFLTSESQIDAWVIEGLPRDELSIQNGIIVTSSTRYPLLVDPQGQGKNWVKSREKDRKIMMTNMNHRMFRQHLEDALSNGLPLLIEDVGEDLDPVLDPVLDKNYIGSGKRRRVKIGDKEVDVEDGFMLYITTKLPNPHYSPETSAKCSIIDFTVTMRGLEDQLLARIILQEKADLEESRQTLMREIADCKKTAEECEEQLLFKLSSVEGNLLDDASLIDVLAKTKAVSLKVKDSLEQAKETETKITVAREEFRPAAHRGSVMYFVIMELSMVNHLYQTSLQQFLELIDHSLQRSKPDPIVAKRVSNIIEFSTYHIFKYIQRGLYETDKPMYQLLMTLKIDMFLKKITVQEFNILLRGGGALDMNTVRKKSVTWIPDNAWLNLNALTEHPGFTSIIDQIAANEAGWRAWYDTEDPEHRPIPDGYEERLSMFQRLLLVRSIREDRTLVAGQQYIIESVGQQYVESIPLDFEAMWHETTKTVPMIGLLSMGSDPTSSIVELAKKQKIELRLVSMGQGQDVIARSLIDDARKTGGWVLLQNCHLSIKYMNELQDLIPEFDDETDDGFRIWITTEPYTTFPINLIQMSIKYTNEPPQGLKAGLRRSYAWVTQDMIEKVDSAFWPPLIYATCFLHSTLIERKRFGPLGWCIGYEFNHTDLVASTLFLENYLYNLEAKKPVSWTTVRYMICEVQYGGRITDDYDKRLLVTYGNYWLDNQLFAPGFQFYDGYSMPEGRNVVDFRAFVDQLPLSDTPQIFGLHPNAELTYAAAKANQILGTIVNVQPKESSAAGGETREDAVLRVAADLLSKMPPDYNMVKVRQQIQAFGKDAPQAPLNVCLRQEADRMQVVLGLMRRTLKDLQLAIAGTVIMTTDLQDALNSLFDARVPPKWLRVSWASPTLGYWFSDVLGRCQQYTSWLTEGRPSTFWLTGFFNPQGFLTAMKQESTRAHRAQGWALDAVTLQTDVLKVQREDIKDAPKEGVYIYGLFLEGAAWDSKRNRLVDSQPKVLFVAMPIIHVTATAAQTAQEGQKSYTCPVYRLPRRTDLNYICDVNLRTEENPEKWVLRGVALLCSRV